MGQRNHRPAIVGDVRFAKPLSAVGLSEGADLSVGSEALSDASTCGSTEAYYYSDNQGVNDSLVNRPARLNQCLLVLSSVASVDERTNITLLAGTALGSIPSEDSMCRTLGAMPHVPGGAPCQLSSA